MDRRLFVLAAVLGFLSVALGAFGAHALASVWALAEGAQRERWWEKAVHYHQVHALLMLALAVWAPAGERARAWRSRAGWASAVGVLLFSGSLYALALTGVRVLGAITPLGGLSFLVAWVLAIVAARAAQDA